MKNRQGLTVSLSRDKFSLRFARFYDTSRYDKVTILEYVQVP